MDTSSKAGGRWRSVVGAQEASGLSVGRYCRREKICAQSFYVWRKRLRMSADPGGGFVRLMPPQTVSAPMEIVTPNGYRVGMRHAEEAVLRRVLIMLRTL